MFLSDALLIGILMGIVLHHSRTRHGPRAALVAKRCVVDVDGSVCAYVPVALLAEP